MFTKLEQKVLDYLAAEQTGAWHTARQIADYSGVFSGLKNRSKAAAMTAMLKKLQAGGYVEMERSEPPAIWRLRK